MQLTYSHHWKKKEKYRADITEAMIEYCIQHAQRIRDKHWHDLLNAIAPVPPSRRMLKVVYQPEGKTIKVITAYWVDEQ